MLYRYLGALNVTFDGSNKLRNASGSLLLMGGKNSTNPVPDDPEVAAQLAELKLEVRRAAVQACAGLPAWWAALHRHRLRARPPRRAPQALPQSPCFHCLAFSWQLDAYADVVVGEVTTELSGNRLDVRSRQTNLGTVACKCAGLVHICWELGWCGDCQQWARHAAGLPAPCQGRACGDRRPRLCRALDESVQARVCTAARAAALAAAPTPPGAAHPLPRAAPSLIMW